MVKNPPKPLVLAGDRLPRKIIAAYQQAAKRLLLLDYDGTLVDFASTPDIAKPNAHVLELIASLSADDRNTVVIISGRDKRTLDNWFGHVPIGLAAEHGAFNKNGADWQPMPGPHGQVEWKDAVKSILGNAISSVPGSKIEEKETAIVFHYRFSPDLKSARAEAKLLAKNLLPVLDSLSLEIRRDEREMVVEVKRAGINKDQVAREWLKRDGYDFVLCAGDSTSDEKMFKVLPRSAISLKVGPEATDARYRISDPDGLIECLTNLQHKL